MRLRYRGYRIPCRNSTRRLTSENAAARYSRIPLLVKACLHRRISSARSDDRARDPVSLCPDPFPVAGATTICDIFVDRALRCRISRKTKSRVNLEKLFEIVSFLCYLAQFHLLFVSTLLRLRTKRYVFLDNLTSKTEIVMRFM